MRQADIETDKFSLHHTVLSFLLWSGPSQTDMKCALYEHSPALIVVPLGGLGDAPGLSGRAAAEQDDRGHSTVLCQLHLRSSLPCLHTHPLRWQWLAHQGEWELGFLNVQVHLRSVCCERTFKDTDPHERLGDFFLFFFSPQWTVQNSANFRCLFRARNSSTSGERWNHLDFERFKSHWDRTWAWRWCMWKGHYVRNKT